MSSITESDARKAFLLAVADTCFAGNLAEFGRALQHKNGDSIRQMRDGRRPITEKTMRKIQGLAVVKSKIRDGSLDLGRILVIPGNHDINGAFPTLERPKIVEWGDVMSAGEEFSLRVKDASMEDLLSPGDVADFSRTAKPMPGKPVLVVDKNGNAYIRLFVPRTPEHWIARARNADFEPLDSIEDGLQIVATMVGLSWNRED